ncbi:patatin-like phospholipase family protein [Burkholderia sp. LMU1-1-1.1]|uniref:patatin-like phospholipase family protein n=1 Tax=Burkholderia sp. LMU1-1-1.1 TaxID=3135266 RepID=UPI00343C0DEB
MTADLNTEVVANEPQVSLNDPERFVSQRRQHLGSPILNEQERWGLALSGGGVRSATFCYGLITALAKNGVFSRFDYMSTVSGGGYIGTMIGSLAHKSKTAEELEKKLAVNENSRELSWLRMNSRYLMPRGGRDSLFAIVTILRNLIGVHRELAVLGLLLGCVLGLVDIAAWWALDNRITSQSNRSVPWLRVWEFVSHFPTLWVTLIVPIVIAVLLTTARVMWLGVVHMSGSKIPAMLTDGSITKGLVLTFRIAGALFTLGVIDWIAWRIANKPVAVAGFGAGFALVLPLLRALMPLVRDAQPGNHVARLVKMSILIDIAGRVAVLALAVLWTAVVHATCTQAVLQTGLGQANYAEAALRLGCVVALVGVWAVVTSFHLNFLNLSSLHNFYRARLTNTYLGAANDGRATQHKIRDYHKDDDIPLSAYQPYAHGGPVHMVNVCVNETFQKYGLFNVDRQGKLMTVIGPRYYRLEGDSRWHQMAENSDVSVGTWMAISGAAAAPGLGSGSRPGWAALLTILGVRLGYWWTCDAPQERSSAYVPKKSPTYAHIAPKYTYLLSELFGLLPGSSRHVQYLSDGGHCENTGVYPLLYQQCELIVLADCGADPEYRFDDLENLLRRARIDLGVDIHFLKVNESSSAYIGTLSDLASPASNACVALASIKYRGGKEGVLVLVKPNVMEDLPEDLHNYYRDHRSFPQQSTADQFFSEDQWESYFSLGRHLGSHLTKDFFISVPSLVRSATPSARSASESDAATASATSRISVRVGAKAIATSTLGFGTLLAASTGVWSAFQSGVDLDNKPTSLPPDLLRPLYNMYAELPLTASATSEQTVAKLASEIMYVWGQAKANHQEASLMSNSVAVTIFNTVAQRCYALSNRLAACDTLAKGENCPRPPGKIGVVERRNSYWMRYDSSARKEERHPPSYCESARQQGDDAIAMPASPPASISIPGGRDKEPLRSPASVVVAGDGSNTVKVPERICERMSVYVQIYGGAGRDNVRVLRTFWREAGADVPPIEDVKATAARQGRVPPFQYEKPTIIYHTADTSVSACAKQLPTLAHQPKGNWTVQPLSSGLKARPNTIEVWLPPTATAIGFDQWLAKSAFCRQETTSDNSVTAYAVRCYPTLQSCNIDLTRTAAAQGSACAPIQQSDLNALVPLRNSNGFYYNVSTKPFQAPFPSLTRK